MPIVATVRVAGDELEVDFTGSGPQARGAMNIPVNALQASVYYSVKARSIRNCRPTRACSTR